MVRTTFDCMSAESLDMVHVIAARMVVEAYKSAREDCEEEVQLLWAKLKRADEGLEAALEELKQEVYRHQATRAQLEYANASHQALQKTHLVTIEEAWEHLNSLRVDLSPSEPGDTSSPGDAKLSGTDPDDVAVYQRVQKVLDWLKNLTPATPQDADGQERQRPRARCWYWQCVPFYKAGRKHVYDDAATEGGVPENGYREEDDEGGLEASGSPAPDAAPAIGEEACEYWPSTPTSSEMPLPSTEDNFRQAGSVALELAAAEVATPAGPSIAQTTSNEVYPLYWVLYWVPVVW